MICCIDFSRKTIRVTHYLQPENLQQTTLCSNTDMPLIILIVSLDINIPSETCEKLMKN